MSILPKTPDKEQLEAALADIDLGDLYQERCRYCRDPILGIWSKSPEPQGICHKPACEQKFYSDESVKK